jgi:hypothetical protein
MARQKFPLNDPGIPQAPEVEFSDLGPAGCTPPANSDHFVGLATVFLAHLTEYMCLYSTPDYQVPALSLVFQEDPDFVVLMAPLIAHSPPADIVTKQL